LRGRNRERERERQKERKRERKRKKKKRKRDVGRGDHEARGQHKFFISNLALETCIETP